MTVTQQGFVSQRQPLLTDEHLDLDATSTDYLYGMHGDKDFEYCRAISVKHNLTTSTDFAEMTFSVPGNMRLPLRSESGPNLQVFDSKHCLAAQRDAFIDVMMEILGRYYDTPSIQQTVGELPYKADLLPRMTIAYAAHLPEVMRATGLKLGIYMLKSKGGLMTSIAMISREHVQAFVREIKSGVTGRAFSYRLKDKNGVAHNLALPRLNGRRTAPRAIRKGIYRTFPASLEMTVVTRPSEPGDVIEVDGHTVEGISSNVRWIIGSSDHRLAPHEPKVWERQSAACIPIDSSHTPTRTLLTLANPGEEWPDCSRNQSLPSMRFFHPDFVSAADLRGLTACWKTSSISTPVIAVASTQKAMIAGCSITVMEDELLALRVLGRTAIEVATIPKRCNDGAIEMITLVRDDCLARYLRTIDTVGATGSMSYVINYESPDKDPTWLAQEVPLVRQQRSSGRWTPEELTEWDELHDESRLVVG